MTDAERIAQLTENCKAIITSPPQVYPAKPSRTEVLEAAIKSAITDAETVIGATSSPPIARQLLTEMCGRLRVALKGGA